MRCAVWLTERRDEVGEPTAFAGEEPVPADWGGRDWPEQIPAGTAVPPVAWASFAAAALEHQGCRRGALVVEVAHDFGPAERALLEEVATDVAFALRQNELAVERERGAVARARLAAIVESSDDVIIGKDLAGVVTSWNAGAERVLGYTAAEMVGRSIRCIVPPDRQAEEEEILAAVRAGRRMAAFDTVRRRKDGSLVDLTVAVSPIRRADGTIIGASKIARDITRRVAAERGLQESLQEIGLFKSALDEHAIVAITDPVGKITYANAKFCVVSGYDRADLLGQDYRLLNSGLHSADFMRELWETIGRGDVWRGEIRNRARDGTFFWVESTIVPLLDGQGRPQRYMAIQADITPIKSVQEELVRSNRDLEQFAYVASHDLQEPLRAVSGCLQVLQRRSADLLDARALELIEHSVDGARRMQVLIEGLLAFSRVGTRGQDFGPVDSGAALDTALRNLSSAVRETGAVIIRDERLPELRGDVVQLALLFQNLVSNALKFHGEAPPRVHVTARCRPPYWEIDVRDEGIGIEPRYFDRIFTLFQRLHTREEYPGAGIGLSLCKKIMERHGGSIAVESQLGHGSTFRCMFPLPPQPAHPAIESDPP